MIIKVLGTGCAKCNELEKNVKDALAQMGRTDTLEKVTDVTEIIRYGVMRTPALVLGSKIVSVGRTLTVEEVKEFINKEETK
jgi:small redox-active disulfide protein 2